MMGKSILKMGTGTGRNPGLGNSFLKIPNRATNDPTGFSVGTHVIVPPDTNEGVSDSSTPQITEDKTMVPGLIPSKKTQNMIITMFFIIGVMLITGWLKLPETFATNALYVIAGVGGVTVAGQAWSDKSAGGSPDSQ